MPFCHAHRNAILGLFLGASVIAGVFTLLPGRIMHAVVFGWYPVAVAGPHQEQDIGGKL